MHEENPKKKIKNPKAATTKGSSSAQVQVSVDFRQVLLNITEGLKGTEMLIIYYESVIDCQEGELSKNEGKPWCLS